MSQFKSQYEWVRRTREALFAYCEEFSAADYAKQVDNNTGTSIRNLHLHVADCYETWLGRRALKKQIREVHPSEITSVQEMRGVFQDVNQLVDEFIDRFEHDWETPIELQRNNQILKPAPLWLFTHTITHEFHHKGQIVRIGRQLGYIPPDTDLVFP
ncbi:DinB family protein [Alicyclobacillus sp. SO9]|uniref:DinB family protein n=1 Tax=Alicyclobacillus sp. SO9 TaxID=2665646 RepID=UPI0018E6E6E2|nr:DinB family protein [Alicyclobacillus sp. SO9]QQE78328.1 DinB family protein [Alicyclobacillus sp. SO9]